jgi:hypothetical protein
MASTVADRPTQKRIIAAAKETTTETMHLIASGRILAIDRTNPEKIKNVEIDHSKVKSSLATLLAASKGLDARECDEAVATIRADQARINNKTPTASSFKQASEALASVAKAFSAAVSQLVAMARSNPRGTTVFLYFHPNSATLRSRLVSSIHPLSLRTEPFNH